VESWALLAQKVDTGTNTPDSFANYDLVTSSWKTWQRCLNEDEEWETFSQTWPRAGMMRNGKCYRLSPLVPRIDASASSLLPTPTKSDGLVSSFTTYQGAAACILSGKHQNRWFYYRTVYSNLKGCYPNPRFTEMMMGFPLGWTDLKD
jgi:hypothetical protein